MVELGTRRITERVRVGNSPPTAARAAFLPDKGEALNPKQSLENLMKIGSVPIPSCRAQAKR
jgi:hypothetical protein